MLKVISPRGNFDFVTNSCVGTKGGVIYPVGSTSFWVNQHGQGLGVHRQFGEQVTYNQGLLDITQQVGGESGFVVFARNLDRRRTVNGLQVALTVLGFKQALLGQIGQEYHVFNFTGQVLRLSKTQSTYVHGR